MIEKGEIYYLSDQFGIKFIKIISVNEWVDNKWVFFYKSPWMSYVIGDPDKCEVGQLEGYKAGNKCERGQLKKSHFEKLLNISFKYEFRGLIKIRSEIIQSICNKESLNMDSIPYMEYCKYPAPEGKFNNQLICKKVSKDEFRNMKLNKILN